MSTAVIKRTMKDSALFLWHLAITPFYLASIALASVFVFAAFGAAAFVEFWKKNR